MARPLLVATAATALALSMQAPPAQAWWCNDYAGVVQICGSDDDCTMNVYVLGTWVWGIRCPALVHN